MKKKVAILGSTGSIGKSTLDIIRKDKKSFEIVFLSANNNYTKLVQQAKEFKVKNIFIKNKIFYEKVKKSLKNSKTRVYNIVSQKIFQIFRQELSIRSRAPYCQSKIYIYWLSNKLR